MMLKAFGVHSYLRYVFCFLFGHNVENVGEPIFHTDEGLVEQDQDCIRCGMEGTSVLPYEEA